MALGALGFRVSRLGAEISGLKGAKSQSDCMGFGLGLESGGACQKISILSRALARQQVNWSPCLPERFQTQKPSSLPPLYRCRNKRLRALFNASPSPATAMPRNATRSRAVQPPMGPRSRCPPCGPPGLGPTCPGPGRRTGGLGFRV